MPSIAIAITRFPLDTSTMATRDEITWAPWVTLLSQITKLASRSRLSLDRSLISLFLLAPWTPTVIDLNAINIQKGTNPTTSLKIHELISPYVVRAAISSVKKITLRELNLSTCGPKSAVEMIPENRWIPIVSPIRAEEKPLDKKNAGIDITKSKLPKDVMKVPI